MSRYKGIKKSLTNLYGSNIEGALLKRHNVMSSMICGLIESGHSSLDKIASKIEGETELTSRIAQAKRRLMSKYTDLDTFYMPHARLTLRGLKKRCP